MTWLGLTYVKLRSTLRQPGTSTTTRGRYTRKPLVPPTLDRFAPPCRGPLRFASEESRIVSTVGASALWTPRRGPVCPVLLRATTRPGLISGSLLNPGVCTHRGIDYWTTWHHHHILSQRRAPCYSGAPLSANTSSRLRSRDVTFGARTRRSAAKNARRQMLFQTTTQHARSLVRIWVRLTNVEGGVTWARIRALWCNTDSTFIGV